MSAAATSAAPQPDSTTTTTTTTTTTAASAVAALGGSDSLAFVELTGREALRTGPTTTIAEVIAGGTAPGKGGAARLGAVAKGRGPTLPGVFQANSGAPLGLVPAAYISGGVGAAGGVGGQLRRGLVASEARAAAAGFSAVSTGASGAGLAATGVDGTAALQLVVGGGVGGNNGGGGGIARMKGTALPRAGSTGRLTAAAGAPSGKKTALEADEPRKLLRRGDSIEAKAATAPVHGQQQQQQQQQRSTQRPDGQEAATAGLQEDKEGLRETRTGGSVTGLERSRSLTGNAVRGQTQMTDGAAAATAARGATGWGAREVVGARSLSVGPLAVAAAGGEVGGVRLEGLRGGAAGIAAARVPRAGAEKRERMLEYAAAAVTAGPAVLVGGGGAAAGPGRGSPTHSRSGSVSGPASTAGSGSTAPGVAWRPGGANFKARDEFVRNKMKAREMAERLRHDLLGPAASTIRAPAGKSDKLAPLGGTSVPPLDAVDEKPVTPAPDAGTHVRGPIAPPPRFRPLSSGRPPLPLERAGSAEHPRQPLPAIDASRSRAMLAESMGGSIWLDAPAKDPVPHHQRKIMFLNDFIVTEKMATHRAINALHQGSRSLEANLAVDKMTDEQVVQMAWNLYQYIRGFGCGLFEKDTARSIIESIEDAEDDEEQQVFEIKRIVAKLPKERFVSAKAILSHLARISEGHERRASAVFAPLVFRLPCRRRVSVIELESRPGSAPESPEQQRGGGGDVAGAGDGERVAEANDTPNGDDDERAGSGREDAGLLAGRGGALGGSLEHLTLAGESYASRGTRRAAEIDGLWEALSEVMEEGVSRVGRLAAAAAHQKGRRRSATEIASGSGPGGVRGEPAPQPQPQEEQQQQQLRRRRTVPGFRERMIGASEPSLLGPFTQTSTAAAAASSDAAASSADGAASAAAGNPAIRVSVPSSDGTAAWQRNTGGGGDGGRRESDLKSASDYKVTSGSMLEESAMQEVLSVLDAAGDAVMSMNVFTPPRGVSEDGRTADDDEADVEVNEEEAGPFGDDDPEGFGWNLLTAKGLAVKLLLEDGSATAASAALDLMLRNIDRPLKYQLLTMLEMATNGGRDKLAYTDVQAVH
ncbi:hypothetical protein HK405_004995 [Cladochytrium tenue]|nr:hypothetical protein HK405_004995 [Cladochytrium tenue]